MKRPSPPYDLLLCMALLASLTACSQTPVRPESPPLQARSWLAPDETAAAPQPPAGHNPAVWWQVYHCDTLDQWIRQAEHDNPDLEAARQTLLAAGRDTAAARGSLQPQVSFDALAGRQKYGVALFGPADFSIPPFTWYEIGPAIQWTPDFSGALHAAIDRQQALADYQARELDALQLQLQGDVTVAALDMAASTEENETVQRLVRLDAEFAALTRERMASGMATREDRLDARARLTADQARLPVLAQRQSSDRHALAQMLGRLPADWTPASLRLSAFALPATLPAQLPSTVARRRPDILVAAASLHAAAAEARQRQDDLYPQITLSADMMQEALTPAGLFHISGLAWAMAAGITQPLWDGGQLRAQRDAAQYHLRATRSRYRQTILLAFNQIADALTALEHDRQALALAQAAEHDAQAKARLAGERQLAGEAGRPETLLAQRTVTLAHLRHLRAQYALQRDYARLAVALGGTRPSQTDD